MASAGSGYITCTPLPDVVGSKTVKLYTANHSIPAVVLNIEEALIFSCAPGYYGLEGEVCLQCPAGAICPGGERFVDLDIASSGYWRINASVSSSDAQIFCDSPRLISRQNGTGCPIYEPCSPSDSCLGNNICNIGYTGDRCSQCSPGTYHRVNNACVKCPDNLGALYGGLAIILILLLIGAYYLNKKNVSLAVCKDENLSFPFFFFSFLF